jgi:hypothetical protein
VEGLFCVVGHAGVCLIQAGDGVDGKAGMQQARGVALRHPSVGLPESAGRYLPAATSCRFEFRCSTAFVTLTI